MEHGCSYGMRMSPEHLQLSIRTTAFPATPILLDKVFAKTANYDKFIILNCRTSLVGGFHSLEISQHGSFPQFSVQKYILKSYAETTTQKTATSFFQVTL